jgi:hypothetical protein
MTKARNLADNALTTVSPTELGYLDGVTSAIQTQIDTKAPSSTAVTLTDTQTLTNKTLTNPVIASVINNSLVDAKGDVLTATADNTPARLAVGANDTVLTADSTAATGLKWAAPSSGGMTLLSTTSLTGATTTISSISQAYNSLFAVISGITITGASDYDMRVAVNGSATEQTFFTLDSSGLPTVTQNTRFKFNNAQNTTIVRTSAVNSYALTIDNYTSSSGTKPMSLYGNFVGTAAGNQATYVFGGYTANTAVTSLVFSSSQNNLSTGTVLLYGVK